MQFGIVTPNGDPKVVAELAREVEQAGWDGLFTAEVVWGADAWSALAAAAMTTSRIRLGTMLSPLPWLPPWRLASQTGSVDHLSNGRAILSVGLGANDAGPASFGYELDRRVKAELLDEGLDILFGLWKGQPFEYAGKHYTVTPSHFTPPPLPVRGRVPTWCVGIWGRKKSMARVLRCDGILPSKMTPAGEHVALTTDDIRELDAFVAANRALETPFDIVMDGETPTDSHAAATDAVAPLAEAGATWWIESRWMAPEGQDPLTLLRERIAAGPPRR